MRLTSELTQDEVVAAMREAAGNAWGAVRAKEIDGAVQTGARHLWWILQVPMGLRDVEPYVPRREDRDVSAADR